jgi:heat shock protein HtpX
MYADIASNKRRSFFLIFLFVVMIIGLGWFAGFLNDVPEAGIILATVLATIMVLISYFKGDSVALLTAGAKPIEKRDHPELYRLVENLSITVGIPCPKIYLIQDDAANAFAAGRKPETASIAVTTGLVALMEKKELEAVLAHEMAHIKNYDILVMTLVVVLVGTIVLFSDIMLRSFIYRGRRNSNGQAALALFLIGIVLAGLSPFIAQFIKLAISRSREYLADASAALMTRYPEGLASALEKIAAQDKPLARANHATAHLFLANPFDPHVTKRFESLFSTHPPINERIERLRAMGN